MLLWGGGKESILALSELLNSGYTVSKLCMFTDIAKNKSKRQNIAMSLIRRQAELLGIELIEVPLMDFTTMGLYFESLAEWQTKIRTVYTQFKEDGGEYVSFGYIDTMFELENQNVVSCGLTPLYPLLKMDYNIIIEKLNSLNTKAWVIRSESYNDTGEEYCGKQWDSDFINYLNSNSKNVLGEDGSYNTFVYDCAMFNVPIDFNVKPTIKINVEDYLNDKSTLDVNSDSLLQQGLNRFYSEIN